MFAEDELVESAAAITSPPPPARACEVAVVLACSATHLREDLCDVLSQILSPAAIVDRA